jgi:dTDP-4-amino-4,6-dideoxygalactose transaminase
MAIHLAGNPCRMDELMAIAKEHNLAVIEDCAQTWGALSQGRPVGTIGTLGCYSFNDFKHVSCGDGGMVATNDEKVGPSLQKWGDKNYDRVSGDRMPSSLAPNYRMSEPQSAVAAAQMNKLAHICERRHEVGTRITRAIGDAPGVVAPEVVEGDWSTYWFYMLRIVPERLKIDRETFVNALKTEGLSAGAGYIPAPVYKYPVFANHAFFADRWPIRELGLTDMDYTRVTCPVAEEILDTCLVIPVNEVMSDTYADQCGQAIRRVAEFYAK